MSAPGPVRNHVVSVTGSHGLVMYGVVTSPRARPARRRVVLFCQAGLQNKGGVGDYFRWLGDELASRGGFTVVRFDQTNTGDSQGEEVAEVPINDFFRRIQAGEFAPDTLDWLRWVHASLHPEEVILWGQCGGCISALMACAEAPERVGRLALLAIPVLWSPPSGTIREFDAVHARRGYLQKLLQPRAYLRLLSGKSEYGLIKAAALSALSQARRRAEQQLIRFRHRARPDHEMFNERLWEAFQRVMQQRKPVLFQMAELDNETPDFDNEFKLKVLDKTPAYARLCTIQYLEQADHSLMFQQSREDSRDRLLQWLEPA